ncbi:hypothetical protein AGMMS50222_10600 [Endomicrobiia bacterium]|nr:hypothetical protein AGMMS50222_10600 [Endomicrobiia bacterium]
MPIIMTNVVNNFSNDVFCKAGGLQCDVGDTFGGVDGVSVDDVVHDCSVDPDAVSGDDDFADDCIRGGGGGIDGFSFGGASGVPIADHGEGVVVGVGSSTLVANTGSVYNSDGAFESSGGGGKGVHGSVVGVESFGGGGFAGTGNGDGGVGNPVVIGDGVSVDDMGNGDGEGATGEVVEVVVGDVVDFLSKFFDTLVEGG